MFRYLKRPAERGKFFSYAGYISFTSFAAYVIITFPLAQWQNLRTSKTANCTFSGELVAIDLKRFTDSGINLVECPDCGRMRSLSPVKGVLRFKAHTRRKQQTPLTEKHWSATGKTDWDVVGGEDK